MPVGARAVLVDDCCADKRSLRPADCLDSHCRQRAAIAIKDVGEHFGGGGRVRTYSDWVRRILYSLRGSASNFTGIYAESDTAAEYLA
jgi:hypothetical protein